MRIARFLVLACTLGFMVGCGGEKENVVVVDGKLPGPAELIKKTLEETASSGAPIGSGGFNLQTWADQMAATDPEKSKVLLQGINELSALQDAAKIKAKAKELLGKL
jgi:hypothetical protein